MFYDLVVPISKLFQILLYLDDVRFSMLSSVGEDGAIGLTWGLSSWGKQHIECMNVQIEPTS